MSAEIHKYGFVECIAHGDLYRRPCSETLYAKGEAVTLLHQCGVAMTSITSDENVVDQADLKRKLGTPLFNEVDCGLRVMYLHSIKADVSPRDMAARAEDTTAPKDRSRRGPPRTGWDID